MPALRMTRFKLNGADADEMVAGRNALVAAVRQAYPGLTEARLAKLDEETWLDTWRWSSRAHAQAALDHVSEIPQAAEAFSLVKDVTAEFADIVDER
jgi:hypothetical protein